MNLDWNESTRTEVARVLETVVREGLPGPRDLDVALDAIFATIECDPDVLMMQRSENGDDS